MVIGRSKELTLLEQNFENSSSSLVVIYGRRRIGKSSLINHYGKERAYLSFEALENQDSRAQISHFHEQLNNQIDDEFLNQMTFNSWSQIFKYLTVFLKKSKKKYTVLLDEFQWMAASQGKLVSLIKFYWDTEWKKLPLQMILCGSIASFMLEKVINSKALYGRIDLEILLKELDPFELVQFFKGKRSLEEILQYILLLGGVPKYFELINANISLEKNLQKMAFSPSGYLFNEYEKIFYSQFREHTTYEAIVKSLSQGVKSFDELSKQLEIASGGGLTRYLNNLEMARFIHRYHPIDRNKTNVVKFKLFDEYLRFYFKYILPQQALIKKRPSNNIFQTQIKPKWQPWLGLAFEHFCLKYEHVISKLLGIDDVLVDAGPYFQRGDSAFQIDLLFKRSDKTWTICECKYREKPISAEVIAEVERKVSLFKIPRGHSIEKVLIAPNGAERSLVESGYFNRIITLKDLFL